MNNGINKDALMSVLPAPLENDDGMRVLAETAAGAMNELWGYVDLPIIYARIDDMSETMLDILAKDFKVDWYNYDFTIDSKRIIIKDSFFVHRHLGTKAAFVRALSDIFPASTVEEWFEYGGEPFIFRVILNETYSHEPILLNSIIDTILYYKSMRSHMEGDIPIVRITCGIVIETQVDGKHYHPRIAGTYPRAVVNVIADNGIILETRGEGQHYHPRISGTNPRTAVCYLGSDIKLITNDKKQIYHPPVTGAVVCSTQYDIENEEIVISTHKEGRHYHPRISGTNPRTAVCYLGSDIKLITNDEEQIYHPPVTGSAVCSTQYDVEDEEIVIATHNEDQYYHPPITGAATCSTSNGVDRDGVSLGVTYSNSMYVPRICGTPLRKL